MNYLINPFKNLLTILFFIAPFIGLAQEKLDVQDSQVEPPQASAALEQGSAKEAFKKIKLDGIAAVVGDYVILESDIEKTLIDLRSQGVAEKDMNRCQLLGK
ncbi:MAG: peptidylprolyl isomerase, partial [Flavobacteriaceae bacterium]|nr:peptidylprolyl isomerase [Flavobacteriaceae bacterium]